MTAADPRSRWQALLQQKRPVLLDGAMGTMLHAQGVPFEACFDALNLERPDLILDIHRRYLDAGAQILLTNTFGANRYRLAEHGLEEQVVAINRAGVDLARRAVQESGRDEVLIAGDVGPLGVPLAPFGLVQPHEARAAFREQMQALADAGVDLFVVETMTDLHEAREALLAAREVAPDLPVVVSVTFTRDDRTLLGDTPAQVARALHEWGADVIGANCSGGPAQLLRVLREMRRAAPDAVLWVKPNAGWPEQVSTGRVLYPAGPDYFAEYAAAYARAGARFVGGCCGTTEAHIRAMRVTLEHLPADLQPEDVRVQVLGPAPSPREAVARQARLAAAEPFPPDDDAPPSRLAQRLAQGHFVFAVEVSPPRGLNLHKVLAGARLVAEAGADVVDVTDSPLARMRMSPWAVCQRIADEVGIETTLHFPTRGRNLLRVQGDLLAAHALGIRNLFVVLGDPTAIGDYPEAMDHYDVVPSGLIKLVKRNFNRGTDYAGNPLGEATRFFVGAALNLTPADPEREWRVMRRKIRAGADFFLTQPVYDPDAARAFLQGYEARYGPLEVPVLVGLLPLYSLRHARFLHHEVPGIRLPQVLLERIARAGAHARDEGVRIAVELARRIRPWAAGLYLMPPFRRYDMAAEVIAALREGGE
ncbi:MAG: bifunctional homocysteine S-methyltransferase/methylenetetrahydrofolate reductase [Chloroflexi bacterium]|nr:bifunctional homocysteine S-methyltransferase/methylenetetrahydrofolate reductase [Chloroflexota bacterium]